MNIMCYISGYDGCGYYRIQLPAKYINKLPEHHVKISYQYDKSEMDWADLIVLQKQVNQNAIPFVEWAKDNGKKICCENDDDYFNIPLSNPAHRHFHGRSEEIINFYKRADMMSVSTGHLREMLLEHTSNISVLPNSLDFTQLDKYKLMEDAELNRYTQYLTSDQELLTLEQARTLMEGKTVIGWGGSPTHREDLEIVSDTLINLCAKNENIVLVMMACCTDILMSSINPEQLLLVKPVPIFLYPQVLYSMRWDIGICPIKENIFNKSKSNLKYLEFSSIGVPVICSDIENYANTVSHGETGMLAENTDKSWGENLEILIDSPQLREKISDGAQKLIREEYDISKNYSLWLEAYENILK